MVFRISPKSCDGRKIGIGTEIFQLGINWCIIVVLIMCHSSCYASEILMVQKGTSFSFTCCDKSSNVANNFAINTPKFKYYSMFEGAAYENGRISFTDPKHCGVTVEDTKDEDEGVWECHVFAHHLLNQTTSVKRQDINVTFLDGNRGEPDRNNQQETYDPALVWGLGTPICAGLFGLLIHAIDKWCCKTHPQATISDDSNSNDNNGTNEEDRASTQNTFSIPTVKTDEGATGTHCDDSEIFSSPVSPSNDAQSSTKNLSSLTTEKEDNVPHLESPSCSSSCAITRRDQGRLSKASVTSRTDLDMLISEEKYVRQTGSDKMSKTSLCLSTAISDLDNLEGSYVPHNNTMQSSFITGGGASECSKIIHQKGAAEEIDPKRNDNGIEFADMNIKGGQSVDVISRRNQERLSKSSLSSLSHFSPVHKSTLANFEECYVSPSGSDKMSKTSLTLSTANADSVNLEASYISPIDTNGRMHVEADNESEKTHTMEIEHNANITEDIQENVLDGSKTSLRSIMSPSLLYSMFLEKYSDVKTKKYNQPRQ